MPDSGKFSLICLRVFLMLHVAATGAGVGVRAMRCKVPYEKVQQNYCYYIADEEPLVNGENLKEPNNPLTVYTIYN